MYILLLSSTLESILYYAAGYVIVFGIGFGLKQALLRKSRKRVLELEESMLKDHATILKLEQKASRLEEENKVLRKHIRNMEDRNKVLPKMMA